MLIPTIVCGVDRRVRFEEPTTDSQTPQTPQQTPRQLVSSSLQPQWCDVRRDFKGRKIIVAHKGPCYGNGPNADGGGKGGTEDVKKDSNGKNGKNGNGGAKDGDKKEDKKEEAKAGGGGDGEKKNGGGGGDEKDNDEFTSEEDEKLKAMKAEGKGWKPIIAELGKSKKAIQKRWCEIDPDKDGGGDAGKNGGDGKKKNGGGEKKDEDKPVAAAEEKKDEGKQKKGKDAAKPAEDKAKTNGGGEKPASKPASKSRSKTGSEARFTMGEWVTLQEDDLFSFGELQLLSELIAKYDTDRWQLVASRFYDKTGRRVHADDVRDKFMGAGAVG